MRNKWILILGLAGILTMSACSTSGEDKPAKLTATSSANSANANNVALVNGMQVAPAAPADANAVNASTAATDASIPAANRLDGRLQELRNSGEAPSDKEAVAVAMRNARPAPENSTFASYLTDAGYEIRTFKNHPQLLKVEKKVMAGNKQSVKVFLRDGRVIDIPGEKIPVLLNATSAFILDQAGVQPQQRQQAPAAQGPTKKGQ